ncbi:MAG: SDR family NAD(P)-dependent oxidoreductase [Thermofilum sp.]|nr:SDR family NAD(P)-dependent oxidoreductase [Thermofilum sp.]
MGVPKMGRILVSGGAGFIGSHLTERLVEKGYDVIVLDNLSRGKVDNISRVMQTIDFIKGDIRDYELIDRLIKNVDAVIHLAALSRVQPSIENPELCFDINVKGTEIIARICSKYNKKLIFASSREVYGIPKYLPVDEEHPLNPENPYGASKVAAESIIKVYSKCYGLEYIILRLANVYGPGDFDRVIPIFIDKALKNEDLIIYGKDKILDFIYISDVVSAFIKALEMNERNLILNIGSGIGTKLIDLAKLIKNIISSNSRIIIKETRNGEVEEFIADISKIRSILKWQPEIDLSNGIRYTIQMISNKYYV